MPARPSLPPEASAPEPPRPGPPPPAGLAAPVGPSRPAASARPCSAPAPPCGRAPCSPLVPSVPHGPARCCGPPGRPGSNYGSAQLVSSPGANVAPAKGTAKHTAAHLHAHGAYLMLQITHHGLKSNTHAFPSGTARCGPCPCWCWMCCGRCSPDLAALPRPALSLGTDRHFAILRPAITWGLQLAAVSSLVNVHCCQRSSTILVN